MFHFEPLQLILWSWQLKFHSSDPLLSLTRWFLWFLVDVSAVWSLCVIAAAHQRSVWRHKSWNRKSLSGTALSLPMNSHVWGRLCLLSACRTMLQGHSPETQVGPHKYKRKIRKQVSGSPLTHCFMSFHFLVTVWDAAAARTHTNWVEWIAGHWAKAQLFPRFREHIGGSLTIDQTTTHTHTHPPPHSWTHTCTHLLTLDMIYVNPLKQNLHCAYGDLTLQGRHTHRHVYCSVDDLAAATEQSYKLYGCVCVCMCSSPQPQNTL